MDVKSMVDHQSLIFDRLKKTKKKNGCRTPICFTGKPVWEKRDGICACLFVLLPKRRMFGM